MEVDMILNFFNIDEVLVQKMTGRRVCPCCNKNYNISDIDQDGYKMSPLLPKGDDPTVCDMAACNGAKLVQRDDDREEIIRDRLEIYKKETEPILDFYKSKPNTVIVDFEAKNGKKDYPQIKYMLLEAFGEKLLKD